MRHAPVLIMLLQWALQVDAASQQSPVPAGSAAETRVGFVHRTAAPITVDGALDEAAWEAAAPIGDLVQREPRPGQQPSQRTEVKLLADADHLYIGVRCYDSEPGRVIGTQMVRDAVLRDDRIEILLDTYRDQRTAFYLATNPLGVLVDGLILANGEISLEWDAIWLVRTRQTAEGWDSEFAIPFKSLSFPRGSGVWGFNLSRTVERLREENRWSGARLQTQFTQVAEAGEIAGLEGVSQGVGLDLRPFLAGRHLDNAATGQTVFRGKPGLDLFYNLTSNLKLAATVNTDFGETEVDARQINLTRFSLFFPEKRSFFLEGSNVFAFSNTSLRPAGGIPDARAQVFPFFSRQIGLHAGGELPIDVGVKLSGTVGRTDLGVLDVRTRASGDLPGKNFFIARTKHNFLRQSYVGAVVTAGHPSLSGASTTAGVDLRLATNDFRGDRNLRFNAYALRSANAGTAGRDNSYGLSLEYPNDRLELEFVAREVQENFRPALGFVSRRNVRLLRAGGRFNPRPRHFLNIQQMFHGVYFTHFTRLDNGLPESWSLDVIAPIDWHFRSGDDVHSVFWPTLRYERLFAPFEIFPGVVLPPGEYRFTRWRNHVATAAKRPWQVRAQWLLGTFWSGRADEVLATVTLKWPPRLIATLDGNLTFAELAQGNFSARILSAQLEYAASPFLTFANLVQYDNVSRNLGWQSRLRWILRPGNDVFLVLAQGWLQDERGGYRFEATDRRLSGKMHYTWRF